MPNEATKDEVNECTADDGLLLYDYINKQLSDLDRARFERHCHLCVYCQEELAALGILSGALREVFYQKEEPAKPLTMTAQHGDYKH
jgi:hypothetical protein